MYELLRMGLRFGKSGAGRTTVPAGLVRELERLEDIIALSTVTQTVTVKDTAGHALANAFVAVTDTVSCKAPRATNSAGQLTVTTNGGIRSLFAYKNGYAEKVWTINSSSSNYTITLAPLTPAAVTSQSSVFGPDIMSLHQCNGLTKVGRLSLSQVVGGAVIMSGSAWTACSTIEVLSAGTTSPVTVPCMAISKTVFTASTAVSALQEAARTFGWSGNITLGFWRDGVTGALVVRPE
jgi:hypothetical protein